MQTRSRIYSWEFIEPIIGVKRSQLTFSPFSLLINTPSSPSREEECVSSQNNKMVEVTLIKGFEDGNHVCQTFKKV